MQAIFEEAFKFAFKDRNWILKILIGGVLGLIPIVNLIFVIGYSFAVLKDSVDNKPATLPEWTDWAQIGRNGLYGLLVMVAYMVLPIMFLNALSGIPGLGKAFYVLMYLVHLVTFPLYTLAMIAWYRKGTYSAAFAWKELWQAFAKNAQNYMIATLVLTLIPLLVSVILHFSGYAIFTYRSPFVLFPGAFIQLVLWCLWFWLAFVSARVLGQMVSISQK